MKYFSLTIALSALCLSCEKKSKYRYIEVVQKKFHSDKIVEKPEEIIEAKDDTSAYLQAYSDFLISQKSQRMISEATHDLYDSSLYFKLLTVEGRDLAKTISFSNKGIREEEIRKSIASLGTTDTENKENSVNVDKNIPGLAPTDVYVNFTNLGFSLSKRLSKEYGNSWTSTFSKGGRDFRVEVYGEDLNTVSKVQASFIRDTPTTSTEDVEFLKYAASLPYSNSIPGKAKAWVEENFDRDKAETDISGVHFQLFAPTDFSRMLVIMKE